VLLTVYCVVFEGVNSVVTISLHFIVKNVLLTGYCVVFGGVNSVVTLRLHFIVE
jgi:hypothetical protein